MKLIKLVTDPKVIKLKISAIYLKTLSVTIGFIFLCLLSLAQNPDSLQTRRRLDSLLTSEHLDTLEGIPLTLYSSGFRIRAKVIQALVKSCIVYYQLQFPEDHYEVQIEILNKKDWQTLPYPQPYGLPHFTDVNQSIIISADKNALNQLNNQLDQQTGDSAVSGFDFVALHELGHYFFYTLHHIDRDHFINETIASYYLICYLQKNQIRLDLGKENSAYSPQHRSIGDFNQLYFRVGPQNYDWYQRRFIKLGFLLYPALGNQLINNVLQNYSTSGKNLDGISLISSLAPITTKDWLNEMQ